MNTETTNIGEMPIEDLREILAYQYGFDSYEELRRAGYKFGNDYDTEE